MTRLLNEWRIMVALSMLMMLNKTSIKMLKSVEDLIETKLRSSLQIIKQQIKETDNLPKCRRLIHLNNRTICSLKPAIWSKQIKINSQMICNPQAATWSRLVILIKEVHSRSTMLHPQVLIWSEEALITCLTTCNLQDPIWSKLETDPSSSMTCPLKEAIWSKPMKITSVK